MSLSVLPASLQAQPVVLDPLAPQVVEFGLVLRPRRFVAIVVVAFVLAEIEPLRQQRACIGDAFGDALQVDVVDRERRATDPRSSDGFIELVARCRESVDVGLR